MRHFTFLLLLLLFTLVTAAQDLKNVSVKFDKNDFTFVYDNARKLYIISNVHNLSYESNTHEPALPYVQVNLLIGENQSYENVRISLDEDMVLTDVVLAPNPHMEKTNSIQTFFEDTATIAYTKAVYPNQDIKYMGTHVLCGYKYVSFLVSPFKYDTIDKKLYLRSNMTLSLNLSDNSTKQLLSKITPLDVVHDKTIRSCLKNIVINCNQIEDLYGISSVDSTITSMSTISYEYLIITNELLKSSFHDLAEWKTMKGVRCKIITTEQIASLYSGNSLQEKIKRTIKDYYNGTCHGLKYVLLGGDVDIVPSRMCHIGYIKNDTVYTEGSTPSDMYYACFDGNFEWDANGNGVYGETDDNVDLLPEVVVTRLPVSTPDQVISYTRRIINYERSPNIGELGKKILMGGHPLYYWYYNMGDSEIKADSIYAKYIQPYWNCERKKLFNTYEGDSTNLFCKDNLQFELAKGYTFVDITTHGTQNIWLMKSYLNSYNTSDAQNLTNSGYSIITTVACNTNAFDSSCCLSEAFIRNENSGVLGYLGCSRQGWYSTWPLSQGPSFEYNGEFYKKLFTESHGQFGRSVILAKEQYAPLCTNDSTVYRWIMLGLNPIGDPETYLFLDTPNTFNANVSYFNGTISINTGVSDCSICVSSLNDFGESYYRVVMGSQASFSNVNDTVSVCLTKPGYIPFYVICKDGDTILVQNESIMGNCSVTANRVVAGSDVTSQVSQGAVVIKDGNVNIRGTHRVTLKNNFKVKAGVRLNVSADN